MNDVIKRMRTRIAAYHRGGGWGLRGFKAHYFDPRTSEVSLCGAHMSDPTEELWDADPLARENCTECRRAWLTQRGLI